MTADAAVFKGKHIKGVKVFPEKIGNFNNIAATVKALAKLCNWVPGCDIYPQKNECKHTEHIDLLLTICYNTAAKLCCGGALGWIHFFYIRIGTRGLGCGCFSLFFARANLSFRQQSSAA